MQTFNRRNLPHWIPSGVPIFVTARLKGTLPANVIETLNQNSGPDGENGSLMTERQFRTFKYREEILDSGRYGPTWLKDPEVARIWEDALKYFDGDRYDLITSTVMSNHVHFIIENLSHPYSKTMQSVRGFSGRVSNKYLDRSGPFWQRETFDRWIRNEDELQFYINYILNNPVKAGVVEHWEDFQFNYINDKYRKYVY